jgi:hypothetical protein
VSFIFKIASITHLESVAAYLLDGTLEDGKIVSGQRGRIRELDAPITIKTVALVNGDRASPDRFTLSVDQPSVDLAEIKKGMILEG